MPDAADARARRVLVIDDRIPTPSQGAGYGRMYDTLLALAAADWLAVDFHARRAGRGGEDVVEELHSAGIRLVDDLEEHLGAAGADVDVVVVSRPYNYELYDDLLRRLLPGVPVIYDAEAVYWRRLEMQARVAGSPEEQAGAAAEAKVMRELEERLFAQADGVVCISEDEAEIARRHARGPVTVVAAWRTDARPTPSGFRERRDIGLVAGWAAGPGSPNADGLLWFGREVLPALRALIPSARLRVTGGTPPDNLTWLEGENVTFVGRVEDLHEFYDSVRVAISPVRFGAGVKLKSAETLQCGVPLVATREGAAGLGPRLAGGYFATDDPGRFATCLATLLTDETAWNLSRGLALRGTAPGEGEALTVADWPDIISSHLTARTSREGIAVE